MTALFSPQPPSLSSPAREPRVLADGLDAGLTVRQPAEVYRVRRLVVVAIAFGLVLGVMSFGRQADAALTPEARAADAVVVIVQPGDTLWGIAQTLRPADDPRGLVDQLSELAGSTSLQPGQEIVIPGHLLG